MKKLIFIPLLVSQLTLTAFCQKNEKIELYKSKLAKSKTATKIKKSNASLTADTLIANFFNSKNIKIKDIPTAMKDEFNFKKGILITNLQKLGKEQQNIKTKQTQENHIVESIFGEFVQRIEYVKIFETSKAIIKAIKEKKAQQKGETNCSFPDIEPSKRYLLKTS